MGGESEDRPPRADPDAGPAKRRGSAEGTLASSPVETVSRHAPAKRRGWRTPVDRPGRRLPPAVAQRQLAPGRVDRAPRSLSGAGGARVANGVPESALANCCECAKGAHRVAARASRRAPTRRPKQAACGDSCVRRPPSPGGGRHWCR